MQTQTVSNGTKYKKGDILRMTNSLKYRIDKVSMGKYTLLPINIYPDGRIVFEYGFEMDAPFVYIDNDKYLTLDKPIPIVYQAGVGYIVDREYECAAPSVPKCECGMEGTYLALHRMKCPASKHSSWCNLYKE